MRSMVWNISTRQLGLAAWLCSLPAPAHYSLAEQGRLEKALDFTATTENISVINTPLILNPKHSSYWEEN